MMNALAQDAASECFKDSQGQIHGMVRSFVRVYGGSYDDVLSEAHEHFVDIFLSHKPERGGFEADIAFRLWHRMLETKETQARRHRLLPRTELQDIPSAKPEPFDMEGFTAELDEDAAEVVRLVFRTPIDIELSLKQRGDSPLNFRYALQEYLKDMGWSWNRVMGSFNEIRKAL